MKPRYILPLGLLLSAIGGAFGYHQLAISKATAKNTKPTAPVSAASNLPNISNERAAIAATKNNPATTTEKSADTSVLEEMLDQVIADAIQRGTLDLNRLTPQQLALLPEKFRKKTNSGDPQLSAEEIAHIEQQLALGDDAPPDPPPQLPCPDPNHLPENYNNDYNKMVLRERGCKI